MSIIVTEGGQKPQKLQRQPIEREEQLQEYIWENPDVLPLDEYKSGVRLLTLVREFPTRSGPIDGVAVDQDGDVYLIETKLYKNPDKRFVLAQVLDYGAALWQTDARDIMALLEERVHAKKGESVAGALAAAFGLSKEETDAAMERVSVAFETGVLRFIVLLDHVDDRLRNLVSFLNHNSRFDVFCVAVDFYRTKTVEVVIPKLHGAATRKRPGDGSPGRRKWDEAAFLEDAEKRLAPDAVAAVRALYQWAAEKSDGIVWGSGVKSASFNPRFDHVSKRSVFSVYSDGILELHFKWVTDGDGPKYAEALGLALPERAGIAMPRDYMVKQIGLGVESWGPKLDAVVAVLDDVLFARGETIARQPAVGHDV